MVNSDVARMEYTTVAGVTEYAIGFQYLWNTDNTPQIMVYTGSVANTPLVYGTDYTISQDGLSIVLTEEPEAGTKLVIVRDVPFTQTSDYTIGRIDPDQIERDLDLIVMREQQLESMSVAAGDIVDKIHELESSVEEIDTELDGKQDTISDLSTIRSGAEAGATAVQPSELGTAAAADATDFATAAQGEKADTAAQSGASVTFSSVSTPKVMLSYDNYDIYEMYVDENGDLYIKNKVELQDLRPNWVFDHHGSIYSLGSGAYSYLGRPSGAWDIAYVKKLNCGNSDHDYDIQVPLMGGTLVVATPPVGDGTYVLKATVSSGTVTYAWVAE